MADPTVQAPSRFAELVLDFLAHLELERGMARNTLQSYRSDLLQFGAFLDARGRTAEDARAADVSDFLTELAQGNGGPGASSATIQRKAAALRSFYRHLRREGVCDSDPTAKLTAPRRSRKLPRVLGMAEVQRLLDQPKGTEPMALRDRALLELMYACGLRASETIDLETQDLDLEAGIVRARGKGSKERLVPVGSAATRAVSAFLSRGRPKLVGDRLE